MSSLLALYLLSLRRALPSLFLLPFCAHCRALRIFPFSNLFLSTDWSSRFSFILYLLVRRKSPGSDCVRLYIIVFICSHSSFEVRTLDPATSQLVCCLMRRFSFFFGCISYFFSVVCARFRSNVSAVAWS